MRHDWERLQEMCDEVCEPIRLWDAVGFCAFGASFGAVCAAAPLTPWAHVVDNPAAWLLPTFAVGAAATSAIGVLSLLFAHKSREMNASAKARLQREMARVERGWAEVSSETPLGRLERELIDEVGP